MQQARCNSAAIGGCRFLCWPMAMGSVGALLGVARCALERRQNKRSIACTERREQWTRHTGTGPRGYPICSGRGTNVRAATGENSSPLSCVRSTNCLVCLLSGPFAACSAGGGTTGSRCEGQNECRATGDPALAFRLASTSPTCARMRYLAFAAFCSFSHV